MLQSGVAELLGYMERQGAQLSQKNRATLHTITIYIISAADFRTYKA